MTTDELTVQLDYLRIKDLKENWQDYVAAGEKGGMGHDGFLRHVVAASYGAKRSYAREMRLLRAKIPEMWVMETYPFAAQPNLGRKRIMNIYDSLDYMKKRQNLVFVGPTGCGKSGLATSYLVRALDAGHTAYFVSFPDLIDRLYKSLAAHREDRLIKTLAAHDCMVIDELGYVDVEPAQVGLFFRLMTARHRLKTTIVTSNLGFQEWGSFLKNDRLTAALIDRLTENSHVVNMKNCVSLRPKEPDAKPSPRKKAAEPEPATMAVQP